MQTSAAPKLRPQTKPSPGRGLWSQVRQNYAAYLFLAPKAILFLLFVAFPVVWAFGVAFQKYTVLLDSRWVGLDNFIRITESGIYPIAFKNTIKYTLVTVPGNVLLALILATAIYPLSARAQTFFRAAFYLPGVVSAVVIAMVWRWLYSQNGLFNGMISMMGFDPIPWLTSSAWSIWSIILMALLTPPGGGIIYYLAAMGSIPKDLYEAADIDGASALQKWWRITLPLLKPTTFYLTILGTIGSFQVFTSVLILTNGGPGHSSRTLVSLIYDTAFRDGDFGYASAQGIVLFLMIMVVAVFQYRFLRGEED
ncbi:MAG TPA: sugar ABC transporter permease [Symbiobacteriaceae bacterium]|nr:sugar ABC transporter permease [Symbiobacteriaceae bacterium]